MNREIKFRLWNVGVEKMVYQLTEVSITIDGRPRFWTGDNALIEGKFWDDKTMPLMQFTGMKDKDSREIYEGDIVEWRGGRWPEACRGEIVWSDCGFQIHPKFRHGSPALLKEHVSCYGITVLGNKYENPLLLNETENKI